MWLGAHGPVPKSAKVRDKKYLRSFRDQPCWGCGRLDGSTVGAHIRPGEFAGISSKPDDDLTVPLCAECHTRCDTWQGNKFEPWVDVLKNLARQRYMAWKSND